MGTATMENSRVVPPKLGIQLLYDPAILLLCYLPEKLENIYSQRSPVFIGTVFTVAKTWKQPKCPLIVDWIKKRWYIHSMEYYSAIRKDEILLPFVT